MQKQGQCLMGRGSLLGDKPLQHRPGSVKHQPSSDSVQSMSSNPQPKSLLPTPPQPFDSKPVSPRPPSTLLVEPNTPTPVYKMGPTNYENQAYPDRLMEKSPEANTDNERVLRTVHYSREGVINTKPKGRADEALSRVSDRRSECVVSHSHINYNRCSPLPSHRISSQVVSDSAVKTSRYLGSVRDPSLYSLDQRPTNATMRSTTPQDKETDLNSVSSKLVELTKQTNINEVLLKQLRDVRDTYLQVDTANEAKALSGLPTSNRQDNATGEIAPLSKDNTTGVGREAICNGPPDSSTSWRKNQHEVGPVSSSNCVNADYSLATNHWNYPPESKTDGPSKVLLNSRALLPSPADKLKQGQPTEQVTDSIAGRDVRASHSQDPACLPPPTLKKDDDLHFSSLINEAKSLIRDPDREGSVLKLPLSSREIAYAQFVREARESARMADIDDGLPLPKHQLRRREIDSRISSEDRRVAADGHLPPVDPLCSREINSPEFLHSSMPANRPMRDSPTYARDVAPFEHRRSHSSEDRRIAADHHLPPIDPLCSRLERPLLVRRHPSYYRDHPEFYRDHPGTSRDYTRGFPGNYRGYPRTYRDYPDSYRPTYYGGRDYQSEWEFQESYDHHSELIHRKRDIHRSEDEPPKKKAWSKPEHAKAPITEDLLPYVGMKSCDICSVDFNHPTHAKAHLIGKNHHKKLKVLGLPVPDYCIDKSKPQFLLKREAEAKSVAKPGGKPSDEQGKKAEEKDEDSEVPWPDWMQEQFQDDFCGICKVPLTSIASADAHYYGKKHMKKCNVAYFQGQKTGEAKDHVSPQLYCEVCHINCSSEEMMLVHLTGSKHKQTVHWQRVTSDKPYVSEVRTTEVKAETTDKKQETEAAANEFLAEAAKMNGM